MLYSAFRKVNLRLFDVLYILVGHLSANQELRLTTRNVALSVLCSLLHSFSSSTHVGFLSRLHVYAVKRIVSCKCGCSLENWNQSLQEHSF